MDSGTFKVDATQLYAAWIVASLVKRHQNWTVPTNGELLLDPP